MASDGDALGAVFNFDGGNLTSAIFAVSQSLTELVLHVYKAVDGIRQLTEFLEDEYIAVERWENEGGLVIR